MGLFEHRVWIPARSKPAGWAFPIQLSSGAVNQLVIVSVEATTGASTANSSAGTSDSLTTETIEETEVQGGNATLAGFKIKVQTSSRTALDEAKEVED